MARILSHIGARIAFAVIVCTVFALAITARPPKGLLDFDQPFYLTIAYDLDRHGIFGNGIFDHTNNTRDPPRPGMFFGPLFPALVWAGMKIDPRFAAAVTCVVESDQQGQGAGPCKSYALPIHLIHAMLLALGVIAIALAGERLFARREVFWLSGALATVSLLPDADLFSFVMTESLTFAAYSVFVLALLIAWLSARLRDGAIAGALLGLLCLTRASFLILVPVALVLTALAARARTEPPPNTTARQLLVLVAAFALVMGPWIARNAISVGKPGVTEEYGSVALIERFAYNDMTAREFFTAFPYCTPGLGDLAFDHVHGKDSMHRFVYHKQDSFFHRGRGLRDKLLEQHGRLDPIIRGIVADEMRNNWWRHLLVSIPLAWCGMWVGWLAALLLVPLFGVAVFRAVRKRKPLFLLYSVPPLAMLALHAAVANHYTRYNLILIGPLAVGSAWVIAAWLAQWRVQSRALAPHP